MVTCRFKLFFPPLALLAAAFVFFSGCQSRPVAPAMEDHALVGEAAEEPDLEDGDAPNFAQTRPRALNRDELTVSFSRSRIQLDFRRSYMADEAQIFTGIFEGLFSYHPRTMAPVPAVAQSWTLSEDGLEWSFTLRSGARFSNGDPVTAQDFRASWLSTLSPQSASPYSSLFDIIAGARDFRTGLQTDPDTVGIVAQGPRTLVVTLNSPAEFFPAMLCHHSFAPIHPSMIDREEWGPVAGEAGWVPPITNGAFRISSMNEDGIVLLQNEYYWARGAVALRQINILFADNSQEAAGMWNSGAAQWIAGNVSLSALTDLSGIVVNPMFATHFYFIRAGEEPWDDYRVRRALSLALPWDEMRRGHFIPARTLISPIAGYPAVQGVYRTDSLESARLLAEAGFPSGAGLPELVIRITPSQESARISSLMTGAWEALGVPVRTEIVPFHRYLQSLMEDGFNVGLSTWIGNFLDPYTFLKMWRRDSNLNAARLDDGDFEALLERSMLEAGQARMATLAEAEALLLYRGTVLPISHSPAVNVIDLNELSGWYPNALNIQPFRYIAFREFIPLPGVVMSR